MDARARARDPAQPLAATSTRSPDDDLGRTPCAAAKRLALTMRERLGCDGVNLLNCCEPAAWQTVFHFHVHVIPRYDDDPLQLPVPPQREPEEGELAEVAAELRVAERVAASSATGDVGVARARRPAAQPVRRARWCDDLLAGARRGRGGELRALLVRAEGEVLHRRRRRAHLRRAVGARAPSSSRPSCWRSPTGVEELPFPTIASVHGLCLTAGLRAVAGLRHDLGRRVRQLRPGRGGGRPDAR